MYVRPAVVRKGRLVLEANLPFSLAYDREIIRRTIHYGRGFRASVAPVDDDIYLSFVFLLNQFRVGGVLYHLVLVVYGHRKDGIP